jgi:hypothetical protein
MEWVVISFVLVIAIGCLFLWVCAMIRKFVRSRFIIRRYVNPAYDEIKCPHCTLGTQYLHPETGWGKIPQNLYMIKSGRPWKNAGQANVRRCHSCGGNGYASTRVKTEVLPDFGVREVNW